jgi:hypothetical protein
MTDRQRPRPPREIVITASRVPAAQLRAIAAHIGDPSPPRTGVTVDEYLDLASTAGRHIVWAPDGRLIELVRDHDRRLVDPA